MLFSAFYREFDLKSRAASKNLKVKSLSSQDFHMKKKTFKILKRLEKDIMSLMSFSPANQLIFQNRFNFYSWYSLFSLFERACFFKKLLSLFVQMCFCDTFSSSITCNIFIVDVYRLQFCFSFQFSLEFFIKTFSLENFVNMSSNVTEHWRICCVEIIKEKFMNSTDFVH